MKRKEGLDLNEPVHHGLYTPNTSRIIHDTHHIPHHNTLHMNHITPHITNHTTSQIIPHHKSHTHTPTHITSHTAHTSHHKSHTHTQYTSHTSHTSHRTTWFSCRRLRETVMRDLADPRHMTRTVSGCEWFSQSHRSKLWGSKEERTREKGGKR